MDGEDVVVKEGALFVFGYLNSGASVVEFSFIKDSEERVEDGATRFEYFIEIGHVSLGQVVGSDPLMFVIL